MPNSTRKWLWGTVLFLFAAATVCSVNANDHKRKRKREHRSYGWEEHVDDHGRPGYGSQCLNPVNNPTYAENCGSCHFAYQPGLLPSGSWRKIVAGLEDHFGEAIALDNESKQTIVLYLVSNAAESSSAKRSVKIMNCLGDRTPIRITEIPYILREHHEIPSRVFERKAVGSMSNCPACHRSAEKGIYDDDDVAIPQ